jgi:DNA-binding CsgD family transcriptional regulator
MLPLDPAITGTIIDRLKLPIFFFRESRLVYSNPAGESLSARLRSAHDIELNVLLQDQLRRLGPAATGTEEAVVLLTSPTGEPFSVHLFTVEAEGPDGPIGGRLVTVRELGVDREAFVKRYILSGRESQVVELVLRGYSNRDIAGSLGVSLATTKKHLTRIFDKVGVDSRAQLISRLV